MRKIILSILIMVSAMAGAQTTCNIGWTTTWGTSPEFTGQGDMPKSTLAGKTIREVIRPSIGGDTIRLRLSNFHSTEPVEIKQIYIAWSVDTVVKDAKTGRIITDNGSTPYIYKDYAAFLTFAGQRHVTIAAGANATSDAIPFRVRPMRNLAITITYGGMVPEHATSHRGSRTTTYIAAEEAGPADSLVVVEKTDHWYNILSLDVRSCRQAVAVLGNSITDGRGTTTNAQNRWTDMMATALAGKQGDCCGNHNVCESRPRHCANETAKCTSDQPAECGKGPKNSGIEPTDGVIEPEYGVINLGIGGNCVLEGGISDPLLKRYRDEMAFHSGIKKLIIFEGTNDIGTSKLSPDSLAERLADAYRQITDYARAKGIKVYVATITPTKGNAWFSKNHEKARQRINSWIRKTYRNTLIDFDKLVRDPKDPEKLRDEYSEDWLHLNAEGYRVMGEYAAGIIGR